MRCRHNFLKLFDDALLTHQPIDLNNVTTNNAFKMESANSIDHNEKDGGMYILQNALRAPSSELHIYIWSENLVAESEAKDGGN